MEHLPQQEGKRSSGRHVIFVKDIYIDEAMGTKTTLMAETSIIAEEGAREQGMECVDRE